MLRCSGKWLIVKNRLEILGKKREIQNKCNGGIGHRGRMGYMSFYLDKCELRSVCVTCSSAMDVHTTSLHKPALQHPHQVIYKCDIRKFYLLTPLTFDSFLLELEEILFSHCCNPSS